MPDFSRYHQAVAYLEGLSNIESGPDYMLARRSLGEGGKDRKDPSIYIKRMQWFLNLLGNPEKGFKYIHITGTAGKGTVASMIQKCLVNSGQCTGLFTSPFVITSIEKIQVGDLYIAPDEFAQIVEEMKPKINEAFAKCPWGGPSYFERFFAIALLYFQKQKCEWVVLEVGCGGRYDATNIIDAPVMSAITNIDYDHTHILGKTLTKIAWDKSGIIKKASKFFTTETRPRLREIMKQECMKHEAEFFYVKGGNKELVEAMGFKADNLKLPARFEIVQKNPLIVIDGAHNRIKMRNTVSKLKKLKYDKLHLIIALAKNKRHKEILSEIVPLASHIYPTSFKTFDRESANPAILFPLVKSYAVPAQALAIALKKAQKDDLILVTGSFYLAGELRRRWFPEEDILQKRKNSFYSYPQI